MAYNQSAKKKEHAFQAIGKDIKADKIGSLVFLCGEEQYLVHWAVDLLAKTYINKACESLDFIKLDPDNLTVDQIKESCETLSMLSPKRVVLIPEFPAASGRKSRNFTEADEKELIEYLADIPDSCLLIITAGEPDEKSRKKESKLQQACEQHGVVYDFTPLSGNLLQSFIIKRFKNAGKVCRNSVIETLIAESGYTNKDIDYNLYNLENDIRKIIAHSEGEEILAADVTESVSSNLETNVFSMLDAISRNRKDEAYRQLHNLVVGGENIHLLLSMIIGQLELILEVKEMREEGLNPPAIQKAMKIHEFRIKKAWAVTEKYSASQLKKILSKAYEIDVNIKNGLMEPAFALEFFIVQI